MNSDHPTELDRQAREIFLRAIELESPEARAAYLEGACRQDQALRGRVQSLLASHRQDSFLEKPAIDNSERSTITLQPLPSTEGPGTRIGRYKLLQQIGEGGMGVVYMAEQEEPVRRRVALKIIKLGMDTRQVVARFEAERQALALMDHPNIAKVLDGGATGQESEGRRQEPGAANSQLPASNSQPPPSGRPYFVMELVQGVPITEFCDKAKLSAKERLNLFIQVCQAVQHAHQKGIIHRDLKPSNVLVTLHDGVPVPKVIDFGIAKATNQKLTEKTLFTNFATMIGTPAYMSPEQAEMSGLDIDTRTDIYALGVLLYQLLTGTTPFPEKRLRSLGYGEMQRVIREEEPERPSTRLSTMANEQKSIVAKNCGEELASLSKLLKGDIDWIVMKALEKDRTRRYETANGLAGDIQRHLNNEPVVARPPSAAYRFQKLVRRNKLAVTATAIVAVTLVLGAIVSSWQATQARRARNEARANELKARQAETSERGERTRAEAEKQRAQFAEAASREQVVRLCVANGVRLQEEGDPTGALLWFARTLNLVQGDEGQERIHRLRYASALQECPRLNHVLKCDDQVSIATFSPDGLAVLTTDFGGARVFDSVNGVPMTLPLQHDKTTTAGAGGSVWYGAFSPDGSHVVTSGADHTARIWDAKTGRLIAPPLRHSNWVFHAEFSPDGRFVIAASLGDQNFIWDARTGRPWITLDHPKGLRAATFSPDGKLAATAGWDGTARIWKVATGELLHTLRHEKRVMAAQFSPDGRYLATGGMDKTAWLWDAHLGRPIGVPMQHSEAVRHLTFSPDGNKLITACDAQAHIWNATTGQALGAIPYVDESNKWPTFPLFSPDGKFLVSAPGGMVARVFDAQTVKPIGPALPHNGGIAHAAFSSDSRRLVTASADGFARVWEIAGIFADDYAPGRTSLINRVAVSPKRDRFVMPTGASSAQLYDAKTRHPLGSPLQHSNSVVFSCFSPDGEKVATVSRDRTARTWSAATGMSITPPMDLKPWVQDAGGLACFSPDGQRLVTATLLEAQVWNANDGQAITPPIRMTHAIEHLTFSHHGKRFITATSDGTARVWHTETGQAASPPLRHEISVTYAAFSPDDRLVVTSSFDQTARAWDATTGEPVTPPLRHRTGVLAAAFSDDGAQVWTVTAEGVWAWKLEPDLRHVDTLAQEATALAGRQIDAVGSLVPLAKEELAQVWQQLRSNDSRAAGFVGRREPTALNLQSARSFLDSLQFHRQPDDVPSNAIPTFVDLSSHFNLGRAETLEFPYENLASLPQGRQTLGGIEFMVGSGVIQLAGQVSHVFKSTDGRRLSLPTKVSGIIVGRSARVLHFLYGARVSSRDQFLARYIVRFRNGQTWEIPISGQDVDGYRRKSEAEPHTAKRALHVATIPTGLAVGVRLMRTAWENPLPDLEIAEIDFVSEMAWGAAYLLAITLE